MKKEKYVYKEGRLVGESVIINLKKMKMEGFKVVKRKHKPSNSWNLYAYNK
jgi:hypothetical protein